MNNPLLNQSTLPIFSDIQPEYIEPAVKTMITENRALLNQLLAQSQYTWDNLLAPLEAMDDRLMQLWAPVSHLHAVCESEVLRTVYNACLPLLTEYHVELMQNELLFKAIQSIADSPEYDQLDVAQRKWIDNQLRDFKLAGVHLNPTDKAHFGELQKKISKLSTQFSENLLDATDAWTLHITDPEAVSGMPETALKLAEQNAEQRNLSGWVFTLDHPSFAAVMKYLSNRELRWLMYEAYVTRASDQGPNAGRFDNTLIMEDILKIRIEEAKLLGFNNYADYSLKTKMAEKSERVLNFLNDLVTRSKSAAIKEIEELQAFAKADGISQLEAWDLAYYTEKLRENRYALSQEELRLYFPIHKVLSGMFIVINQLFGITINEVRGHDVWHPTVQLFEIRDANNELRGYFYTDLYARPHKREGAWMDECRVRRRLENGNIQIPVAFLTCNFSRPVGTQSACLTHEEIETLFHEFGHCLHHLLTQVDYLGLSGINGVPWDAVEFPSQFLEHWTWQQEVITLISAHVDTGEPLPSALYNKLLAARNFQSGMHMLRQLEFALFDFRLHVEYDLTKGPQVQEILDKVRQTVSVITNPKFNRFQHSFSHIFSGGYAAGYYSYKWAEVLSSDAFSLFEEKGIFDTTTGQSFLKEILEQGGVRDPMVSFVAFRGREPTIDALLRHSGL